MDNLCFCSVLCLLCLCARLFICALWSPAGKGLTSWDSFVVSAVSLSLSIGILGQVWYLIVSIPNLCTLTYFTYFNILVYYIIHTCNTIDNRDTAISKPDISYILFNVKEI